MKISVILGVIFLVQNASLKSITPESGLPESLNISDDTITEIQALLDYETGFIFYRDDSIPACLFESIPKELYSLKLPISPNNDAPSETLARSKLEKQFIPSQVGKEFCNDLPVLNISEIIVAHNIFTPSPFPPGVTTSSEIDLAEQNALVRRRRQVSGYYPNAPMGEARAQSNWNPPGQGQASQAQVQGQVFGSGFFSGQAQTQNGVGQSQVQLSGVGIRGHIASSSGNAQAQLSLGNGAGSGQAAGLGVGPSSSQVQVTLGKQDEETMASASATSGGARAELGGGMGGSFAPLSGGGTSHYGYREVGGGRGRSITAEGQAGRGVGGGFYPGAKLFDESVLSSGMSMGPRNGGSVPYAGGSGSHIPHQNGIVGSPSGRGFQPEISQGVGISNGFRYGSDTSRDGTTGGGYGTDSKMVRTDGLAGKTGMVAGIPNGHISGARPMERSELDSGSRSTGYSNGITQQGAGVRMNGVRGSDMSQPQLSGNGYGANGIPRTEVSQIRTNGLPTSGYSPVGAGGHPTSGYSPVGAGGHPSSGYSPVGAGGHPTSGYSPVGAGGHPTSGYSPVGAGGHPSSGYSPAGGGTGTVRRPIGTDTFPVDGIGSQGFGDRHSLPSETSRGRMSPDHGYSPDALSSRLPSPKSVGHQQQPGMSRQNYLNGYQGPSAQSSTPGAHASAYGLGQAQAQTVYFGYSRTGQIVPISYDQSSQPSSGTSGQIGGQRSQDQQVGLGTASQHQRVQNGYRTAGGNGGSLTRTDNGYKVNGLSNGHTSILEGTRGSINGGHPLSGENGAGRKHPSEQYIPGAGTDSRRATPSLTMPQQSPDSVYGDRSGGLGTDRFQQLPATSSFRPSEHYVQGTGTDSRLITPSLGTGLSYLPQTGQYGTDSRSTAAQPGTTAVEYSNGFGTGHTPSTSSQTGQRPSVTEVGRHANGQSMPVNTQQYTTGQQERAGATRNGQPYRINGYGQVIPAGHRQTTVYPTTTTITGTGELGQTSSQDGFSPSYGISKPSDSEGRECVITFSCTILIESNGRAKICKPNRVKMNGHDGGGAQNGVGSTICCC